MNAAKALEPRRSCFTIHGCFAAISCLSSSHAPNAMDRHPSTAAMVRWPNQSPKDYKNLIAQMAVNHTVRGQQRDKPFRDALRMETKLAEEGEDTPAKPGSLRYIARALLNRAGTDTPSAVAIADRLDGKPAQAIVGDDEHDAIRQIQTIERVIVKAPDRDGGSI